MKNKIAYAGQVFSSTKSNRNPDKKIIPTNKKLHLLPTIP